MAALRPLAAYAAVLFDMDGTLVATEDVWFATERAVAARHGVTLPDEAEAILHGLDADGLMTALRERYGLRADADAFLAELGEEVGDRLRDVAARPGAADLVGAVAAAGLPRAVVSNAPHVAIRATLAPHPWAAALPLRISVEDVARGKPEPDPYLHAAERLDVDVERCLVVEDSAAGATAAVRAGATCVAVTHDERPASDFRAITPHVIRSLADLLHPVPRTLDPEEER